jgi:hypothetical protein
MILHVSEEHNEPVDCGNGHSIAAPKVDQLVRENETKVCQEMRAVHWVVRVTSHSRFRVTIPLSEREICLRLHRGGESAAEFLTLQTASEIYARQRPGSKAQLHLSPGLCDSRSNPDCEIQNFEKLSGNFRFRGLN